jgi:lysophospholipase L1-like esterase
VTDRRPRCRRRLAAAGVVLALLVGACSGDDGGDRADETTTDVFRYAALGDSGSAGTGAPPYDQSAGSCQRAAGSWPRLLERDSDRITSIDHRACGGATVLQLVAPWAERRQAAQIPADADPSVKLVTLTIGGNDVGFGTLVLSCVLATCIPPTAPDLVSKLQQLQRSLADDIYPELRRAYPKARIAHLGYSYLTPPTAAPIGCPGLEGSDQATATALVDAIDAAIEAAADQAGVTYVDTKDVLAGHELCSADPWVVPIGAKDQAHATAQGQVALEHAVAKALDLPLRSS